ncbi:MAG: helix-turn-helix domain-containing protein [Planctomycetes bacterium]|nr:helix-turn-helix domain-containing protein [Planctomycetota bacterium]
MKNEQPAWLSTKQAAALLAVHPDTLRRYRREGGGPPFSRIGRAVRYSATALDAWMQQRSATSTTDEAARMARPSAGQ